MGRFELAIETGGGGRTTISADVPPRQTKVLKNIVVKTVKNGEVVTMKEVPEVPWGPFWHDCVETMQILAKGGLIE